MNKLLVIAVFSFCYLFYQASASSIGHVGPPCRAELTSYLLNQESERPMMGVRKPNCDSDGFYAPKQCSGSQCYCVMTDGSEIDGFTANIWEAEAQTCKCARDKEGYNMYGKMFFCTSDGSYEKVQCQGSVCFCADENGDQIGTSHVPIGQSDSLNC